MRLPLTLISITYLVQCIMGQFLKSRYHVLAHFALNVSDYGVWLEDVPPQFHSCFFANFDGFH